MSRSYRKQPVWKDHNHGMKAMANRKVRRALNRDHDLDLRHHLYKRYFCSWDICDYCSLVPRNFEEYYQREVIRWKNRQVRGWPFRRNEPFPTRKEVYKEWLSYRNK